MDEEGFFYWAHGGEAGPGYVGRMDLEAGDRTNDWLGEEPPEIHPHPLTADHEKIYWIDPSTGSLARANIDGSDPEPEWVSVGFLAGEESLAVTTEWLYFSFYGCIGRLSIDGVSLEEEWIPGISGNYQFPLCVTATHIYFQGERGGIGRVELSGANLEPEWLTDEIAIEELAADDLFIYFTENSAGIGRVRQDGSGFTSKWLAVNAYGSLCVTPTRIYWREGIAGFGRATIAGGEIEPEWTEAGGEFVYGMVAVPAEVPEPEPNFDNEAYVGNPFTYPAFDMLTQLPLDKLPYTSVSFGREVNHAGPWAGQLLISDPRIQRLNYLGANNTGSTALFVDWLGKLIWGGVIWMRRYKRSTKTIMVGAQEFGSYFQQRLQAYDYSMTWEPGGEDGPTDPMVIAETIIQQAQDRPEEHDVAPAKIMGGIPIILNRFEGSAPPVAVSYPGTQLQTIDSIVSTLSQMGYTAGFDYSFDCEYLPGTETPAVTLNFWYPRQGVPAAESNITILGSDLVDLEYDEDSSKQANLNFVTGSSSGGIGSGLEDRATAAPPGYPLLEATTSHTQITSPEVLARVAASELALRVWPVTTPQLILPVPMPNREGEIDPTALSFRDFDLGDDAHVRIDPVAGGGRNTDPRFPKGLSFDWRITNWACQVADKGVSTLTFNLGTPPSLPIPLPPQPPLI